MKNLERVECWYVTATATAASTRPRCPASSWPATPPSPGASRPARAVENAVVLEFATRMALHTFALLAGVMPIARPLLDKHYRRKHGPAAYGGQPVE